MLVHDHKIEKSEVFDFREVAPAQAKPDMYAGREEKQVIVSYLEVKFIFLLVATHAESYLANRHFAAC